MFGAWTLFAGWGGRPLDLVRSFALVTIAAIVAGWIIGRRGPGSIAGRVISAVAYGPIAYLVLVPLNVLGAMSEDIQAGRVSTALDALAAAGAYLLYGVVTAVYVGLYLIPFGAGWMATFFLLRRGFDR